MKRLPHARSRNARYGEIKRLIEQPPDSAALDRQIVLAPKAPNVLAGQGPGARSLDARVVLVQECAWRTRRRGGRLLSREKRLQSVEVQFGEETFVLSLSGETAETTRVKAVRGVVIKREQLPLDAWLAALSDALSAEAQRSEAARLSLERLLG